MIMRIWLTESEERIDVVVKSRWPQNYILKALALRLESFITHIGCCLLLFSSFCFTTTNACARSSIAIHKFIRENPFECVSGSTLVSTGLDFSSSTRTNDRAHIVTVNLRWMTMMWMSVLCENFSDKLPNDDDQFIFFFVGFVFVCRRKTTEFRNFSCSSCVKLWFFI